VGINASAQWISAVEDYHAVGVNASAQLINALNMITMQWASMHQHN
jgi:hypothetical protein